MTVGKPCTSDAQCEVPGKINDNVCSIGFFTIGDLYGDPVCVSACTRGFGNTFADILCDGDTPETSTGVCNAGAPGSTGVCLPSCEFDSLGITSPCFGGNKCAAAYFGTEQNGDVYSLGICLGACMQDSDCHGSVGTKCQREIGLCVSAANYVTYTKTVGQGCNGAAVPEECSCNTVGGIGPNANRGTCGHTCVTGPAGDALCNSKAAGWICSASLPTQLSGSPGFTGQPAGILGGCAKPCNVDADCATLAAAANVGGGTTTGKCEMAAGGKICVLQ